MFAKHSVLGRPLVAIAKTRSAEGAGERGREVSIGESTRTADVLTAFPRLLCCIIEQKRGLDELLALMKRDNILVASDFACTVITLPPRPAANTAGVLKG